MSEFRSTSSNVIARVDIGRQDHWRSLGKGEGRELSVSTAILQGVVVHKGLRLVRLPSIVPRQLTVYTQRNYHPFPSPNSNNIVLDVPTHLIYYPRKLPSSRDRMAVFQRTQREAPASICRCIPFPKACKSGICRAGRKKKRENSQEEP